MTTFSSASQKLSNAQPFQAADVDGLGNALSTGVAQPATQTWGSSVDAVLSESVQQAFGEMIQFRERSDYDSQMALVFGANYDAVAADQFFDSLVMGPGVLPKVEVLDDSILGGALGAYAQATDTVYMSRQFLESGTADAITGVLIEEFGHGIDARVNAIDTSGDEGNIFARIVQSKSPDEQTKKWLDAEDDSALIQVNGSALTVERHTNLSTINSDVGGKVGQEWKVQAVSDINGDGKADVIWRRNDGQMHAWMMDGNNILRSSDIGGKVGQEWQVQAVSDINGDGKSDVIWRNNAGQMHTWMLDGSNILRSSDIGGRVGQEWQVQAVSDINGDGKSDVIWRNNAGQMHTWMLDGSNILRSSDIGGRVGQEWQVQAVSDINGDEKSDVVWRRNDGQMHTWILDGSNILRSSDIGDKVGQEWQVQAVSDINGDGNGDVVWRRDDGQMHTWLLDGHNILRSNDINDGVGQEWQVQAVSDINGDGNRDVVWRRDDGQMHAWMLSGESGVSLRSAYGAALIDSPVNAGIKTYADDAIPLILDAAENAGITDKAQIAYILATARHESLFGLYMEEIASGADYEGRSDLGNVNPGDGVRFKGRGYVQITGRRNYQDWSNRLGVDLVSDPEKAEQPEIAARILVEGMRDGTFTGRKLSDYISGGQQDFENARRIVNGTNKSALISGYANSFLQILNTSDTNLQSATRQAHDKSVPSSYSPYSSAEVQ